MILFTDQTTNLVKDGFSRLRPCHDPFLSDITRLVKEFVWWLYMDIFQHMLQTHLL